MTKSTRRQIIDISRLAAKLIRSAKNQPRPELAVYDARIIIETLSFAANIYASNPHSQTERQTARRCAVALSAMIH